MTLVTFWFVVLVILDRVPGAGGSTFGVGMLHGVVGRDEEARPARPSGPSPQSGTATRCG